MGSCRGHVARFRWRWDLLFELPSESAIVLVAVAKLLLQMQAAPASSFLGGRRAVK